ncbi:PH domain-containing protein [Pseudomonas lopnurensis]|uniref:PH domain-containing protein n=1 Tax=Pseudomonas lopnurensis TaxID=1477517 RepID=UPI0028ABDAA0|nr:PH domain-containing protein [Pseudomonas lopnurensis]
MQTVYPSKIDWWLAVALVCSMAVCAWASVNIVAAGAPAAWWLALPTMGLGTGLPPWLLFGTRYILEATHLRIKSGPFAWRVPLADITSITPTANPLSSPALSLDRLRIDYGRGSTVMISPRDKEQFIQEIEALRRAVG